MRHGLSLAARLRTRWSLDVTRRVRACDHTRYCFYLETLAKSENTHRNQPIAKCMHVVYNDDSEQKFKGKG